MLPPPHGKPPGTSRCAHLHPDRARIGHHNGDEIGRECALTGKTVREVVLERGLMTPEELDEVLSIDNLLKPQYFGEYFHGDD